MYVDFRNTCAKIILHAATLVKMSQIKRVASFSKDILTQSVLALTSWRQAPGRVAVSLAISISLLQRITNEMLYAG